MTRILTSWVAVLALLAGALAPSISQAIAADGGASWVEVCTSAGARWVQPVGASSDPAPASHSAHPFEHCPYCSLHANALAIPVAEWALAPAAMLPPLLPSAYLAAPRTLHAWASAQPRAPPTVS